MKSLLLCALFVSSAAFACPDITGTFVCKFNSAVSQKEISKTETGFKIISEGYPMEYITDGRPYEIPATDSYKDAFVKSSCSEKELIIDFNASILYEGTVIAKEVSKTTYSMDSANLIITQKTKMKGLPMPAAKWNCTRK